MTILFVHVYKPEIYAENVLIQGIPCSNLGL